MNTARPLSRQKLLSTTALQAVAMGVLAWPAAAQLAPNARPLGGQVVAGSAAISTTPSTTTIDQSSSRAAINWQSFNVGRAQSVEFHQPSSSAVVLNRVTGPDPSAIAGRIDANGQVIITNPSGVVFSRGSQVNAQSLVVSAAGITNANLLAGRAVFDQAPHANARIENAGTITVRQAGLAAMVAPSVANSGVINARLGPGGAGGGDDAHAGPVRRRAGVARCRQPGPAGAVGAGRQAGHGAGDQHRHDHGRRRHGAADRGGGGRGDPERRRCGRDGSGERRGRARRVGGDRGHRRVGGDRRGRVGGRGRGRRHGGDRDHAGAGGGTRSGNVSGGDVGADGDRVRGSGIGERAAARAWRAGHCPQHRADDDRGQRGRTRRPGRWCGRNDRAVGRARIFAGGNGGHGGAARAAGFDRHRSDRPHDRAEFRDDDAGAGERTGSEYRVRRRRRYRDRARSRYRGADGQHPPAGDRRSDGRGAADADFAGPDARGRQRPDRRCGRGDQLAGRGHADRGFGGDPRPYPGGNADDRRDGDDARAGHARRRHGRGGDRRSGRPAVRHGSAHDRQHRAARRGGRGHDHGVEPRRQCGLGEPAVGRQ